MTSPEELVGDRRLGHHALAARVQHVDLRALLVRREVRLQEPLLDAVVLRRDPRGRRLRRLAGEVLARGVAGRVVEARVEDAAGRVLLDVLQPPGARRGLGHLLDLVEVLVEPHAERPRLARAGEDEGRRALHAVVEHGGLHAARLVEELHAAVVGGHERPLGRRERHVELALGLLAVDEQRTGEPDRDLGHAGELLDVAGQDRGVERVGADVLELRARALAQELAAGAAPPRACSRPRGRAGPALDPAPPVRSVVLMPPTTRSRPARAAPITAPPAAA